MESIPRVLFQRGEIVVYTYTVIVAAGLISGTLTAWGAGYMAGSTPEELLEGLLWALVGAAGGAYAWDVGVRFLLYGQVALGTAVGWPSAPSVHGVLWGGGGALVFWARRRRWAVSHVLDVAAVGVAVGSVFVWAALLIHGGVSGVPVNAPWAWRLPDVAGIVVPRVPVQALGLGLNLLLGGALTAVAWFVGPRRTNGWLFLVWMVANSAFLGVIGFWRADPTIWIGPLRLDQVAAFGEVGLVMGLIVRRMWKAACQAAGLPAVSLPAPTSLPEE
ncbi:MAG: prolipoprotein diacylglyceryl transferase [Ardenticatenia bacterium]|nr:prolipoprotein diacylglyceryl transferase [Ardenticatenia bacterium]